MAFADLLPLPPTTLLFLIPVLGLVVSSIHSYLKLRHIPGPFLAHFSYLYVLKVWFSRQQMANYSKINGEFNSRLVRIGPNDLLTDDPAILRQINGARSGYARSTWYDPTRVNPYRRGLFDQTNTAEHERLRSKVAAGYQGKENESIEGDIDGQLLDFMTMISEKYATSPNQDIDSEPKRMDMAEKMQYFTLDSFTKLAYGKPMGFMAADSDLYSYMAILEQSVPAIMLFGEWPILGKIFLNDWVLKLIGPKPTDKKGLGVVMGIAQEVVNERWNDYNEKGGQLKKDMLGAWMKAGLTKDECETEVPFQMVAGSDTTATAMRATFLQLCVNRQAYNRLQQEIDAAIEEKRVSRPVITAEESKRLPYLQAVILEGLRMQTPFTGLLAKEVPPGGDTINGVFIPGGVRIGHNTAGVQLRKDIFGEDADVFRPERWLTRDEAKRSKMVQATELVFGYGRWQCLGKPVAYAEMGKVYFEVS
ncbi:cytochrome p450 [Naviculisporaceae sp. PSN 640]